jgi:methionine-rich copper-binding protein CopC
VSKPTPIDLPAFETAVLQSGCQRDSKSSKTMSSFQKISHLPLAVVAAGLAISSTAWSAPITINGSNSYTQSFDGLISTGSGTWADDSTIAGWYGQRTGNGTTIAASTGFLTGGNLYSFGTAADRALGSLGSGNAAAGSFAWGVQFQNTGAPATIGTLSFTGEQWRNGGNASAQTVTLWYKISSTAVTSLNPGASNTGWTALTAGTFTSPVNSATAATLDGNAIANRIAISFSSGLTLNSGEYLMLRWSDPDHSGNDHGLAIDDFSLSWTTAGGDTTPPTLASVTPVSPADNATGVAIGTSLSATFSESIAAGTGSITLYKASDNSVVQSFTVGTSAVNISGATATFTPTAALANNTEYYVLIPSGVIVDGASNAFTGITTNTAWSFTTVPADTTAPTIVSVTPTTGTTNLAPPTSLTITFSENVQIATSGSPKVYVKRVSDDQIVAEAESGTFGTIAVTDNVATVPVSPALDYGVAYYVTIDAGALEDVSTNNNDFVGLPKYVFNENPEAPPVFSWTFTTIDVPGLNTTYAQDFSTYTSLGTLPLGWSFSGGAGFASGYIGDWGTTPPPATVGGFTGNASVFGYQHNSLTLTTNIPLLQTLTLRNTTGATLTDLSVAYKGRVSVAANTRIPAFTVSVAGTTQNGLSYSTADGDNQQRNVAVTGLNIADGATFQITWSSLYPAGAGSARQIGISDVSVAVGSSVYAPTVASMTVPTASIGGTVAVPQADVISDGSQTLSARGFVYSITSVEPNPTLGAPGTTTVTNAAPTTGPLSDTLSGLSPATTYSVRAYATNPTGTAYSQVVTFTTLALPPSLLASYSQEFSSFNSGLTLPPGWSAISSLGVQSYASAWTSTSSTGGFSGAETTPGVLGYRHTSNTGVLTVTLRMINGTSATLNSLYVKYLGRTFDTLQTRSPIWTVAVNGVAVPDLDYSTASADLTPKGKVVTGLSIAPGSEFTITWTSDRGLTNGSSKKIGISSVEVAVPTAPVLGSASASSITGTGATLNGSVTADGFLPITARGFVYSVTNTNADPIIDGPGVTTVVEGGTTTGSYTSPITGLASAVGYSLKAYATNSLGTTYSSVASFRTGTAGVSYDDWNDAIANQAANLDFDGDGISNGVEFFMGTPGDAFTANPGISAGTVTWPRAIGTLITSFKVEVSTNLTTWTDASVTYPGSVSAPSNGPITFTLPSGPTTLFIRLNVTP